VEHLGDSVAGRYLLVAPQAPRASRRQYHAVDMLLDRMVTVRFEPRSAEECRGLARLRTADGRRVLDGGMFEGSSYVVVENGADLLTMTEPVSVDDLEMMLASPSAPDPQDKPPSRRVRARVWVERRSVMLVAEFIGVVLIVLLLAAATIVAVSVRDDPDLVRPSVPIVNSSTTAVPAPDPVRSPVPIPPSQDVSAPK